MTERRVCVLGAGGHAKVVIQTLRDAGYGTVSVYDDDPGKQGQRILGVEVTGTLADAVGHTCRTAIIGIGDNRTRAKIATRFPELDWIAVIHPSAVVAPDVRIGPGSVIFAGAVVQPGTTVGAHVIVNTGATVDHDCVLGDFVHVAPGCHLAGQVTVGTGAFLGIGSAAIPGMRIGDWATVGAGGVVISHIPDRATAIGVPARIIKQEEHSL